MDVIPYLFNRYIRPVCLSFTFALTILIAFLFQHNYASSTVNTYVPTLGYIHRLAGVADPTRALFIMGMLKGYGKVSTRFQTRLPITVSIFELNGCVITVHLFWILSFRSPKYREVQTS